MGYGGTCTYPQLDEVYGVGRISFGRIEMLRGWSGEE